MIAKPVKEERAPRKVGEIQAAVADLFGLNKDELLLGTNRARIVEPRQLAMYLARKITRHSLPELGLYFGHKHHTTVLHAIRKIERERLVDDDINNLIGSLMRKLGPDEPVARWPRGGARANDFSRLVGLYP